MTGEKKRPRYAGHAWLQAARAADRRKLGGLLEHLRFSVLDPAAFPAGEKVTPEPDVVIVVVDGDEADVELLAGRVPAFESSPPIVVFGPARARTWRKSALRAGVFACLSLESPVEERISVIIAASRFQAVQKEIQLLRRETDLVVQGLLESYGAEAEQLRQVVAEAQRARASLEAVRKQIIKSML